MSLDRACRAHSGLVCKATWNCRRKISESSSILQMACRRVTSRVFALLTPSLVSRSSRAVSIVEPRTPTMKLYWAAVQVVPCLLDAHLIYSRCRTYLVSFSRSLSCAQSRDQSAPMYQSHCCEAPSPESIGLVYSRKAHILAITLKPTPSGRTLRNAYFFGSVRSSASQYPFVTCNNVISFPTSEQPICVLVSGPCVSEFLSFPTPRA